jgi:uncharacterized surface protein with fasciclin (FAS1) repeats
MEDADIACANGMIHVIDSVLIPAEDGAGNIVQTAEGAGTFNTLVAAVKAAGLGAALSEGGPLTVFAPTDEAFAQLPEETLSNLLKPENKSALVNILKYHVVSGRVTAGDALNDKQAKTLNGQSIDIAFDDGSLRVQQANILAVDIEASNGLIHVIDRVLLPPEGKKTTSVREAIEMIETAIQRGVPVYNDGNAAGCAEIYMDVSRRLMEAELPGMAPALLKHAVNMASRTDCSDTRAWTLRHGLDRAHLLLAHAAQSN